MPAAPLATSVPDLSAWALTWPKAVRKIEQGTNNEMWVLDEAYVVRRYQNLDDGRVQAEHRLLSAVSQLELPFATPLPLPARDGRTVVDRVAIFPYLRGEPGRRTDEAEVSLAAAALARLDAALAPLPLNLAPTDWRVSIDRVHPAVQDISALCKELDRAAPDNPDIDWLRRLAGPTEEQYLELLETLPVQIVHDDFALSNTLFDGGAVTAVLDFEFAGIDLRVNDLVSGLSMLPTRELRSTFHTAYNEVLPLEPAEVDAIPVLLRYRDITSAVWRAGRWLHGQATLDEVLDRLTHAASQA